MLMTFNLIKTLQINAANLRSAQMKSSGASLTDNVQSVSHPTYSTFPLSLSSNADLSIFLRKAMFSFVSLLEISAGNGRKDDESGKISLMLTQMEAISKAIDEFRSKNRGENRLSFEGSQNSEASSSKIFTLDSSSQEGFFASEDAVAYSEDAFDANDAAGEHV
jgi:hypothetical protein